MDFASNEFSQISIVISVASASPLFHENFRRMSSQNQVKEIIAVCNNETVAASLKEMSPKVRSIWSPSAGISELRAAGLAAATGSWVVFLDHDCVIEAEPLKNIDMLILGNRLSGDLIAGFYKSLPTMTYLQRAHNTLCNLWAEVGSRQGRANVLGGAFMVNRSKISFFPPELLLKEWGGEDAFLAEGLVNQGCKLQYCSDLQVVHSSSPSIFHAVRRAFVHGRAFQRRLHPLKITIAPMFLLSNIRNVGQYLPFFIAHKVVFYFGRLVEFLKIDLSTSKNPRTSPIR